MINRSTGNTTKTIIKCYISTFMLICRKYPCTRKQFAEIVSYAFCLENELFMQMVSSNHELFQNLFAKIKIAIQFELKRQ